jgi:plastocyanin
VKKAGSGLLGLIGAVALMLPGGCGRESPSPPKALGDPAPAPPPLPLLPSGTIAGTIGLQLKEPGQPAEPLPNVFVSIKSGLEGRTYPVPADPVVLDQITFQFVPRVFGIRAGQTLRITSQDSSQHNVFCQPFKNSGFNVSLFGGEVVEKKFNTPEVMILLQCNIHHIMKAYAGVLDHPFFAVTGPDGGFEIKGLPPGRYTLSAWQETMGNQDVEVDLKEGGRKTLTLIYK